MNGPDPWAAMPIAHGEGAVNCSLCLPFSPLPFHLLGPLSVCPATVCQATSCGFWAASELAELACEPRQKSCSSPLHTHPRACGQTKRDQTQIVSEPS